MILRHGLPVFGYAVVRDGAVAVSDLCDEPAHAAQLQAAYTIRGVRAQVEPVNVTLTPATPATPVAPPQYLPPLQHPPRTHFLLEDWLRERSAKRRRSFGRDHD